MVRVLLMALANQDISVLSTKHAKVPVTPLAPHGVCLARILPFPPQGSPSHPAHGSALSPCSLTWRYCLGPSLVLT